MLPTLGAERRATYSPFLPISQKTGMVLQVPILEWDAGRGTIVFEEDGKKEELPVTGGHVKLQWKADWAMRWLALGVDYEMAGKDLISSVDLSSKIVRAIGGHAAGRLQLRTVPGRSGPEDLQVQGQRLVGRRMADLRHRGKPGAVHVPEAARRQAALFRRHPQGGGRLHRAAGAVSRATR